MTTNNLSEKAMLKLAKQEQKEAEKRAKQEQKEAEKLDKQIVKEAEQLDKQTKRETEKLVRMREKEASRSAVLKERERVKELAEKKALKKSEKYEIQSKAIGNMVRVAKQMAAANPGGFTITQITQKYISMFPNTNPYTLEPIDDPEYDVAAAIRGFIYETSPSSDQHWFRYGYKKIREQVAPWIFVNKELAIVNNSFAWKKTTSEIVSARRQNKGVWKLIPDGSLAFYDWNEEEYGPLPSEELLIEAAENRKKGVRRNSQ
jgi:hypothetical protein